MHTIAHTEIVDGADPKTRHVWMPDRRTLCDLRAELPVDIYAMSDQEFKDYQTLQRGAPACGSCLLLVGRLRNEAVALMTPDSKPRVWPASPRLAWARLLGTRWEGWYAIRAFIDNESLDENIDYTAIRLAVDPERITERRSEWAKFAKAQAKTRRKVRSAVRRRAARDAEA